MYAPLVPKIHMKFVVLNSKLHTLAGLHTMNVCNIFGFCSCCCTCTAKHYTRKTNSVAHNAQKYTPKTYDLANIYVRIINEIIYY